MGQSRIVQRAEERSGTLSVVLILSLPFLYINVEQIFKENHVGGMLNY